ncbi:MAG: glycosyltransferase, partial [Chitinophagaceae bacterium]|nr:glycosyltransferase [Chitinophagaceae bacterium]
VCVQSCDPVFSKIINEETKQQVAQEYHLPKEFFLSVGSIIERKNLLNVCKALLQVQPEIAAPLVVIGNGRKYKKEVKTFIAEHGLEKSVIFLSEQFGDNSRISQPETLAAIYQLSLGMIYPSFYEGFGLPVMEALSSEVPVITSNVSSLPEAGGDAAFYVNPAQPEEIATGMKKIYGDKMYVQKMKEKGKKYALQNTGEMYAHKMMKIYQSLC